MADTIAPGLPTGQDAIKGGVFQNSALIPGGTFANVPLTVSTPPPSEQVQAKLTLTLEQLKEELKQSVQQETNTTESDPLSAESINTFLSGFVQLLIDYKDLRNYVFFGSAYNELVFEVNYIIKNYPYKSFFGRDVNNLTSPPFTLTPLSGGYTRVQFHSSHIVFPANFTYDESGKTIWTNFDLVDTNGTRFPIQSDEVSPAIETKLKIIDVSFPGNIEITTTTPHALLSGATVVISGVEGTTNANNTTLEPFWYVKPDLLDETKFGIFKDAALTIPVVANSSYVEGGIVNFGEGGIFNFVRLIVKGNISPNNFIEYTPSGQQHKGLVVSPKVKVITDFNVNTSKPILALLDSSNPVPWPREPVQEDEPQLHKMNIIVSGPDFDTWVSNPNNATSGIIEEDLGFISAEDNLNLTGALTLDESVTNNLLRRGIPERIIDELNDTSDKLFTRFILVAGKFFDTIKVYIDFLKYVHSVNYDQFNQLSPEFYTLYAEHYGFDLFEDENLDLAKSVIRTEAGLRYDLQSNPIFDDRQAAKTLKELQNEKQKRLLVNLFSLYKTKGTQKCIKFLTSLLGAPEGLILLQEYVFNQKIGEKEVDNTKYNVPQIDYEIDPDYLVNKSNVNDPINFPYVYRLKLDNEHIHNLREISLSTDPQSGIANDIVSFGKIIYAYGNFGHKAFANLQNYDKDYYLLPLTFPDKYYGVTIEYNISRDGFIKGDVGKNNNEVTIHLASLFEVASISYAPVINPSNGQPVSPTNPYIVNVHSYQTGDPIRTSAGEKYTYRFPPSFDPDDILGSYANDPVNIKSTFEFTINLSDLDYINTGVPGNVLEVFANSVLIGATVWKDSADPIIDTLENALRQTGLTLVNNINFKTTSPDLVAFYKENLDSNGNFTGITITVSSPANSIIITQYNNKLIEVKDNSFVTFSGNTSYGEAFVQNRQFIITRLEGKDLVVRVKYRDEVNFPYLLETKGRVAIVQNIFTDDGLNHQLRVLFRPEGVEIYQDFKFIGFGKWKDPSTATLGPYTPLEIPKSEIFTCQDLKIDTLDLAFPDNDDPNVSPNNTNPGADIPRWWDLFVGLPQNINMFFNRVAVFEALSIDQPDVLDEGLDLSGLENEKWSFSFNNQGVDNSGNKLINSFSIPVTFRAPAPEAENAITDLQDYFNALALNNIISDIKLLSKDYIGGKVEYIEQVQSFYKLPNGEQVNIPNLFKYNAWSKTLHKDYTYENLYNKAWANYENFSNSVLTYISLLPFMELIESRFQGLVRQFIPIVINLSDFGRLIQNNPFNQLKVHYNTIDKICDGTLASTKAVCSFIIQSGVYDPGNNTIEVKINGIQYALQDWVNTNSITAQNIATEINSQSSFPNIEAIANGNQVIITIDPDWFYSTYFVDVNTVLLGVNTTGTKVVVLWNSSFSSSLQFSTFSPEGSSFYPSFTPPNILFYQDAGAETGQAYLTSFLLIPGQQYIVRYTISNTTGVIGMFVDYGGNQGPLRTVNGTYNETKVATGNTLSFNFGGNDTINTSMKVTIVWIKTIAPAIEINDIKQPSGGVREILGDDCLLVEYISPQQPVIQPSSFIYFDEENGPETFIFFDEELIPPLYIYFDEEN